MLVTMMDDGPGAMCTHRSGSVQWCSGAVMRRRVFVAFWTSSLRAP